MPSLRCGQCKFTVEGDEAFCLSQFAEHCKTLHSVTEGATVEGASLIRRAIADVAGTNTALRSRLQAAAADLQASGFSSVEIADRLTSGESVE